MTWQGCHSASEGVHHVSTLAAEVTKLEPTVIFSQIGNLAFVPKAEREKGNWALSISATQYMERNRKSYVLCRTFDYIYGKEKN